VAASHPLEGISTRIAVFSGPVAPTLLDVARDEHIDLIVMSSHGYSGFKRWLMGSVTECLLEHSSLSVLIVRPREQVAEKSEVTQDNILQEVGLE